MKKIIAICSLILSLLMGTVWAADFSRLVIIHTNDTHGYDRKEPGSAGLAAVSALRKEYLAKGYQVLLVDAGDAIQDNVLVNTSKGKAAIQFMNACGYDAMALGNHEFDYGQDITLRRIKEANFPIMGANVIVKATGKLFTQPHTILHKGDLKIGVFALATPLTEVTTNAKNVYGLDFLAGKDLYKCAQQQVEYLQEQKCDLIIALTHLGSLSDAQDSRSEDLLANVQGIDICIDGHDHTVKNKKINGTLLVETGYYTHNIGLLKYTEGGWSSNMIKAGTYEGNDPKVEKMVAKEAANVKKKLSEKIAETPFYLNGERYPGVRTWETNLGDLCADAVLWQAREAYKLTGKVDASVVNGGTIRSSLATGPILRSDLIQVLPYNNLICVVKVSGATLREMLEAATSITPEPMGAFPQVSGIDYEINTQVPYVNGKQYLRSTYYAPLHLGSRVTIKTVNGAPFDPKKIYTLGIDDFVKGGGDAYGVLKEPGRIISSVTTGYVEKDALENYLKSLPDKKVRESYRESQKRIVIK